MGYNKAERTPNIGLPQWSSDDKPERADFNRAFRKIDKWYHKLVAKLQGKADKAVGYIEFKPELYADGEKIDAEYNIQAGKYYRQGNHVHLEAYIRLSTLNQEPATARLYMNNLPNIPFTRGTYPAVTVGFFSGSQAVPLVHVYDHTRIAFGNGTTGGSFNAKHITKDFCIVLSADYIITE